jgi:hypothetical protein
MATTAEAYFIRPLARSDERAWRYDLWRRGLSEQVLCTLPPVAIRIVHAKIEACREQLASLSHRFISRRAVGLSQRVL